MFYTDLENNIFITRGDTGAFHVTLTDRNGEQYMPSEGELLRFAMAKRYDAGKDILIDKEFPAEELMIYLNPQDTKNLKFGEHVYDVELKDENGDYVETVISARMIIMKEV